MLHSLHQLPPPFTTFLNNPTPNPPRIRPLRITGSVDSVIRRRISHPHIRIQLIQIPETFTGRAEYVGGVWARGPAAFDGCGYLT